MTTKPALVTFFFLSHPLITRGSLCHHSPTKFQESWAPYPTEVLAVVAGGEERGRHWKYDISLHKARMASKRVLDFSGDGQELCGVF